MPLSLTKPSAGAVGWSGSVNQNFEDIETLLNTAPPVAPIGGRSKNAGLTNPADGTSLAFSTAITIAANTFANGLMVQAAVEVSVERGHGAQTALWIDVLLTQNSGATVKSISGKPSHPWIGLNPSSYPNGTLGGAALYYAAGDNDNDGGNSEFSSILFTQGLWVRSGYGDFAASGAAMAGGDWDPAGATVVNFGNLYRHLVNCNLRVGRLYLVVHGF